MKKTYDWDEFVESDQVNNVDSAWNEKNFHDRVIQIIWEILKNIDVSSAEDNKDEFLESVRKTHAVLFVPHSFYQNNKREEMEHISHDSEQIHHRKKWEKFKNKFKKF